MKETRTAGRPDWDDYFLEIVDVVAARSTCARAKVGCVIVVDRHVVSTGYVGSPPGSPHCEDIGCLLRSVDGRDHCVRTTHAEANAIAHAAKNGVRTAGGTAYCSLQPCPACARLMIGAGIKRIVAGESYHAPVDDDTLLMSGVKYELRRRD